MKFTKMRFAIVTLVLMSGIISFLSYDASAESVPTWIKNTAKWYGEGVTTEADFLNAIKFLIENEIIVLETKEIPSVTSESKTTVENVIIPNGNSGMGNAGFYLPLNLEINEGTTVIWINDDQVGHTIQSQDVEGNIISMFNSDVLETGERFAYKFEESGEYNYFCTLHPWRVGVITVK